METIFDDNSELVAQIAQAAFQEASQKALQCGYSSQLDKDGSTLRVGFKDNPPAVVELRWTKVDPKRTYLLKHE